MVGLIFREAKGHHFMSATFIAEVSSNHAQDLNRCLAFVDAAADVGADAVKFQLFRIERMFAPEILAQSKEHRSRKAWELPTAFLEPIVRRCKERNIAFACTPFDLEAVEELKPYVAFYKIASYELLWDDLLITVAETGKPVILSTGMATIPEIVHATDVLKEAGALDITVLHCVSAYPTPPEQANLRAIETLRAVTGVEAGWSDHTVNKGVVYRAVTVWGASVVEFHLDLDGHGAEYKAGHCWLPDRIADTISHINDWAMLDTSSIADGTGEKVPNAIELAERDWRTDPSDGLRPLKHIRKSWKAA